MGSEAFGTVEPLPPSYFKSKREYVCVTEAIRHCWEEQVGSSCNVFIETHDIIEQWKSLVQNTCRMLFVYDDNAVDFDGHEFEFRKDVLYTVAEVVQLGMLQLFEGAHDISCTIAECTGTYPILTSDCLRHTCLIRKQDIFDSDIVDGIIENDRMPDERYRDSILLLLSRRAAIARMTNEAMELAWTALVNTIVFLIRPAEVRECVHTLVPRQIEAAAKYLGITNKVHGFDCNRSSWSDDFWEEARYVYEEEVAPMEIEVAGNETSRDNGSIDGNGGSVDAVVDMVADEADIALEALSDSVKSDKNGVVGDHDGVGIESYLGQSDEDMMWTTCNAHHCVIC